MHIVENVYLYLGLCENYKADNIFKSKMFSRPTEFES